MDGMKDTNKEGNLAYSLLLSSIRLLPRVSTKVEKF